MCGKKKMFFIISSENVSNCGIVQASKIYEAFNFEEKKRWTLVLCDTHKTWISFRH